MKYIVLYIFSHMCYTQIVAQDIVVNKLRSETSRTIKKEADTSTWIWKRGGLLSFNLSQASLSNWAAGGDNFSLAVNGYFNYFFYHRRDRMSWDNNIDVNIGYVQSTSFGGRKNDDRLDFLSKCGYKMDSTGKWYLSGLFNFRSQFFDGYAYNGKVATLTSTLLSPAYVLLSAGFDYKPDDKLSIFLSPLTSRTVIVASNKLAKLGVYGLDSGIHVLSEFGAFATVNYNNNFDKNITYKVRLDLFSNYRDQPLNIDIFMTNLLSFKINKNFSATYGLDIIYDDNVRIFGANNTSPGLQTKSLVGINYLRPLNVKRRR
ncbi:MAG: DUF3078 domain-containing protein [Deinococcales bacterium]|nr:DUF3078 domain-containing protein [Chitinophagaceae bacterium]